ncbi:MAG TPA: GNAT family protein [Candidatus Saccharimonadales bacterium]|nr:GNAT family protein [Candidatus Saccharimonadales bacterium]
MLGPTLKGDRVTLRPIREEEAEIFVSFLCDPVVTRFMGSVMPITLEQELEWLKKESTNPNTVLWGIEFDERLVGNIGMGINWDRGTGELGAMLGDRSVWGLKLMKEAGQLARDYLFTHLPLRKIKGGYIDGNGASQRAQERAGFHETGRLRAEYFRDGAWRDHVFTELWREDWEKQRAELVNESACSSQIPGLGCER